jgi:general secretion pathway protein G
LWRRGFTLVELVLVLAILGVLASLAIPGFMSFRRSSDTATAIADIQGIDGCIDRYYVTMRAYPPSLVAAGCARDDPWGNPYRYLNIQTTDNKGKVRKDKNLVPLNSDYDLYSMGPDGRSVSPLTAAESQDDIVRANNGKYIGVAEDY